MLRSFGSRYSTAIDNQSANCDDFNQASTLKLKHIPQGECWMAKAGAGEASALSPDGISMPMSLSDIALCFASDVSAKFRGINAEGSRRDRKRSGYHCHRVGIAYREAMLSRRMVMPRRASARSGGRCAGYTFSVGIWGSSGSRYSRYQVSM